MFTENLKLARAWKPTTSSSIQVICPRLNQGECPPRTLPTQSGLRAPVQQKNITYCVFYPKTADFPRFIVIESLEDVCLDQFSPFIREKIIATRATPKNKIKKHGTETTSWGRQPESVWKYLQDHLVISMVFIDMTKYKAYPHEIVNTSKEVVKIMKWPWL